MKTNLDFNIKRTYYMSMNSILSDAISRNYQLTEINNARYISKELNAHFLFLIRIEKDQFIAPQIVNRETGEVENELVDQLLTKIMSLEELPPMSMARIELYFNIANYIVESRSQLWSA